MARRSLPPAVAKAKREARAAGRSNAERYVALTAIPPRFRTEREKADLAYFKKTVSREAIRASRAKAEAAKYAQVLEREYGPRNPGVGARFLDLPQAEQEAWIEESQEDHREWIANGREPLGNQFNEFLAYH